MAGSGTLSQCSYYAGASIPFLEGDKKGSFLTSASYFNQDGILAKGKSNFKRITVNLNSERRFFNDHLKVGENVSLSKVERQSVHRIA